jgi:hypothetical protein
MSLVGGIVSLEAREIRVQGRLLWDKMNLEFPSTGSDTWLAYANLSLSFTNPNFLALH